MKTVSLAFCVIAALSGPGCKNTSQRSEQTTGKTNSVAEGEIGGNHNEEVPGAHLELEQLADYGLAVRWGHDLRRELGGDRIESIDVVNERLIIETLGARLYHLDAGSGRLTGKTHLHDVLTAPPAMDGDTVYAHTFRGMAFIGAHTGLVMRRLAARTPVNVRPVPFDGDLILGSASGSVLRFATGDGAHRWSRSVVGTVLEPMEVRDRQVFAAGGKRLIVINAATGRVTGSWRPGEALSITSGPAVHDGLVFIGMNDRSLYCLSNSGNNAALQVEWRFPVGATIVDAPVIKGENLLVSTLGGETIYMKTSPSPQEIWSHPDAGRYLAEGERGFYFLTPENALVLLEPETGEEKMRVPLKQRTSVSAHPDQPAIFIASPEGVIIYLQEKD